MSNVTKNNQSVSSLALLPFAFTQCTRRRSYEPFLLVHQAFAVLGVYAMWCYVKDRLAFPGLCVYLSCGTFVVTALQIRSRDTEGSYSEAVEGGRYVTLPNRRRMLMESLGDELVAKDLIDNALAMDESKQVSH